MPFYSIFLSLPLFIYSLSAHALHETESIGHVCKHDLMQSTHHPIIDVSHTIYDNHPFNFAFDSDENSLNSKRRLSQQQKWQPIRIVPIFSELENDLRSLPKSKLLLAKKLVLSAINYYETRVKVIPVKGNLRIHRPCMYMHSGLDTDGNYFEGCVDYRHAKCFLIDIPTKHLARDVEFSRTANQPTFVKIHEGGDGIANADITIYVVSKADVHGCQPGSVTIAWAGTCAKDQHGRPIAGLINICPHTLLNMPNWRSAITTITHELNHVLVFSAAYFGYFRHPNGKKMSMEDTVTVDSTNGVWYLTTPQVTQTTREHYGCPELFGATLENFGHLGTAGSHWDYKNHMSAMMTGIEFNNIAFFTIFTWALMQDSGWYMVEAEKLAQPYMYGYHKGCEFVNGPCFDGNNNLLHPEFFCDSGKETAVESSGCSYDGKSMSKCTKINEKWLVDHRLSENYVSSANGFIMDERNHAFPKGSKRVASRDIVVKNWCNFQQAFIMEQSRKTHICMTDDVYNQRCINYELVPNQNFEYPSNCMRVECKSYNFEEEKWSRIYIHITHAHHITCSRAEEQVKKEINIQGVVLQITCPAIDLYCVGSKPFECLYGYWNEYYGKCDCSPGYTGEYCSQEMQETIEIAVNAQESQEEVFIVNGLACMVKVSIVNMNDENTKRLKNAIFTISPNFMHGGYLYTADAAEDNKLSFALFYEEYLRRWYILKVVNDESSIAVAYCTDIESIDNPNILKCNGKWQDIESERAITLIFETCDGTSHCGGRTCPRFFEKLRQQT